MSYDEEIKRIQDELRAESEKAFSLDEGAQGKDGLGAQYLHNAVSEYNRKLKDINIKYGK